MTKIIMSPLVFFRNVSKLLKPSLHLRRANLQKKPTTRGLVYFSICKIYERLVHDNMSDYFSDLLSKFQCGLRKRIDAQNCLLYMIETIQKIRSNHGMFTVVITDLPKAFNCISHELLIGKLSQIISYLKNRTQTTKVGSSLRELLNIIHGAPQGSILATLLFVIFICDLFFCK